MFDYLSGGSVRSGLRFYLPDYLFPKEKIAVRTVKESADVVPQHVYSPHGTFPTGKLRIANPEAVELPKYRTVKENAEKLYKAFMKVHRPSGPSGRLFHPGPLYINPVYTGSGGNQNAGPAFSAKQMPTSLAKRLQPLEMLSAPDAEYLEPLTYISLRDGTGTLPLLQNEGYLPVLAHEWRHQTQGPATTPMGLAAMRDVDASYDAERDAWDQAYRVINEGLASYDSRVLREKLLRKFRATRRRGMHSYTRELVEDRIMSQPWGRPQLVGPLNKRKARATREWNNINQYPEPFRTGREGEPVHAPNNSPFLYNVEDMADYGLTWLLQTPGLLTQRAGRETGNTVGVFMKEFGGKKKQ
jgi:hypothetical protein